MRLFWWFYIAAVFAFTVAGFFGGDGFLNFAVCLFQLLSVMPVWGMLKGIYVGSARAWYCYLGVYVLILLAPGGVLIVSGAEYLSYYLICLFVSVPSIYAIYKYAGHVGRLK